MSYFKGTFLGFLKTQWVKGLCTLLVVLGVISQISNHLGLVYSRTDSLPHHLFLHFKQLKPKRGDCTCIDCPWYGGRVIKKVVGIGGDSITYDATGSLWVGRHLKVGRPKKKAKDGRLLTPIKSGIIPQGKVFVMGEHERSFDSRYEELGLVLEKELQGRLVALV